MKPVYVDFDDVLCETAAGLTRLLAREFGKTVDVEDIHEFNLEMSFGLTATECAYLMEVAHRPDILAALPAIAGAVETIRRWADDGIPTVVVTGRPASAYTASRDWLARHQVPVADLLFLDKYQRHDACAAGDVHVLSPEDLRHRDFLAAVEDSPAAIALLAADPDHHILVFDQPWNRDVTPESVDAAGRLERCRSWHIVDAAVRRLAAHVRGRS